MINKIGSTGNQSYFFFEEHHLPAAVFQRLEETICVFTYLRNFLF